VSSMILHKVDRVIQLRRNRIDSLFATYTGQYIIERVKLYSAKKSWRGG